MKLKDIALLCTAAAGAGAAGAVTVSNITSSGTGGKKKVSTAQKAAPKAVGTQKPADSKAQTAENITPASFEQIVFPCSGEPVLTDDSCGILTVVFYENNTYRTFRYDGTVTEIRCPAAITYASSLDDCTFFATPKGGITVYTDTEREPVLCVINSPVYVSAFRGEFYVFSDSLLYICTRDGQIRKTVSLCSMTEIHDSDICDAENSDDSFSSSHVDVAKAYPLGSSPFAAVLTEDGGSYLMHEEDGFVSFEKAYDNIISVCSYGELAYYLWDKGITKTALEADSCVTLARYGLSKDEQPCDIISAGCGLAVLYKNGRIKMLLPETAPDKKDELHTAVKSINAALADVTARKIYSVSGRLCYLDAQGRIFINR